MVGEGASRASVRHNERASSFVILMRSPSESLYRTRSTAPNRSVRSFISEGKVSCAGSLTRKRRMSSPSKHFKMTDFVVAVFS